MDRRLGRPLPHQLPNPTRADPLAINLSTPITRSAHPVLLPVSQGYSEPKGTFPRVTHPSAATPDCSGAARLACVRPAASVRSEPGSNSQVETPLGVSLTSNLRTSDLQTEVHRFSLCPCAQVAEATRTHKTVKLTPTSSTHPSRDTPSRPICCDQTPMRPNRPHIPS